MRIERLEKLLNKIFNSVQYAPDGSVYSIKKKIGQENHVQFYIYPDEHPPPHFHVYDKSKDLDASFRIDNCELHKGKAAKKYRKVIKYFYSISKDMIANEWNNLNPKSKVIVKQ